MSSHPHKCLLCPQEGSGWSASFRIWSSLSTMISSLDAPKLPIFKKYILKKKVHCKQKILYFLKKTCYYTILLKHRKYNATLWHPQWRCRPKYMYGSVILFEFCLFVFSRAFPAFVVVVDFFHKKKFCHYSLVLFGGGGRRVMKSQWSWF